MPKPVPTTIAFVATTAMLTSLTHQNSSVSESGRELSNQASEYECYVTSSISFDNNRYSALEELAELMTEHSIEGWDGALAPAISSQSTQTTKEILKLLPKDISDPEFAVEAEDGAITMEWYGGYRKVASISINKTKRLAFASLNGTDSASAVYGFDGIELSPLLLASIRSVLT